MSDSNSHWKPKLLGEGFLNKITCLISLDNKIGTSKCFPKSSWTNIELFSRKKLNEHHSNLGSSFYLNSLTANATRLLPSILRKQDKLEAIY